MSNQQEQQLYNQPQMAQQPPQVQYPGQPMPMYQPPPQPGPKRRRMWIILGITAAVVVFACIGMSTLASRVNNTGTIVQNSQSSNTSNTKSTGNTTDETQNQHFSVGQTVKVGDTWQVTVNSATTSKGKDYSTPKDGTIYLLVDVSLKNIASDEKTISSLGMFTLRDSTGQEYTESVTTFTKPPDGKVEAGAPLRGTLAYEVPTTEHQFTFAFAADMISSGQTTWDIKA